MKIVKRLAGLLTASLIAFQGSFIFNASAKADIKCEVSYSTQYTYLTLTPTDEDNVIRYTVDGSTPTENSRLYKNRLRTKKALTIRVAEFDENGKKVDAKKITLKRKCSKPEAVITKLDEGYEVTLSTETAKAKIYYTLDGTKPGKDSIEYKGPFTVEKGDKVYAVAVKSGWKNSAYFGKTVIGDEKEEAKAIQKEYDELTLEIHEIVNKERKKAGMDELELDEQLCEAASIRAKEIYESYGHSRPDGRSWSTVLKEVGFVHCFAGENIAYTEGSLATPEIVMDMWMNSQGHKDNILNDNGSLIGIGCYKKGDTVYWVQLFGERM